MIEQCLNLDEIKGVEIGLLHDLDEYCREKKLTYFVCYGTLIGAIRHKGFIPWDDDVDILMPRPDYEQLIESYSASWSHIGHCSKSNKYPCSYAKLINDKTRVEIDYANYDTDIGLSLDIFPLDSAPNYRLMFWIQATKIQMLRKIRKYKTANLKLISSKYKKLLLTILQKYILRTISLNQIVNQIEKCAKHLSFGSSDKVTSFHTPYAKREYSLLSEYCETFTHSFENIEIQIPKNYDSILKRIYGDYMSLPPEEKRTSNHSQKVYWRQ